MRLNLPIILSETPPDPSWLVPGLLTADSMVILAGDPGVGKSFFSYSLALSLAAGLPFLGFPTEPHRVCYFDEENALPDLGAYLNSLWRGLGRPDPALIAENLHVEHFSLGAIGTSPYGAMANAVQRHAPALIILDTVTPVCRITDENDNAEASQAIRELRRVKGLMPTCTMLLLKHARYLHDSRERTIRGAKAWIGELDATIYHTLPSGRPRSGLRRTQLEPGKVRAYGLREPILIDPVATGGGILLTQVSVPSSVPEE